MSKITIDPDLASKLVAVVGRVELCDPAGKVLGAFVPQPDPQLYDLEPKIGAEELQRREQSNDYVPMEDVLRDLGAV